MLRSITLFTFLWFSSCTYSQTQYHNLTNKQVVQLGALIWKNEGQQKLQHLTVWNRGEDFPSLGLGHFIWYPNDEKGPFEEQFPALLTFFEENGVELPTWLDASKNAPWKSREYFYSEFDGERLTGLRKLLSDNLNLQVKFIILRLERATPEILSVSTPEEKKIIEFNLNAMKSTPEGLFALIDYINFKGEGISEKECYQGEGWGLKQVLLTMPKEFKNPLRGFGFAADEVLTRRVKNAPKDESRWLKGWRVRVHSYKDISVN